MEQTKNMDIKLILFRVISFLLDNVFVLIIVTLLTFIPFFNPKSKEYTAVLEKMTVLNENKTNYDSAIEDNVISKEEYEKLDSEIFTEDVIDKELTDDEVEDYDTKYNEEYTKQYNKLAIKTIKYSVTQVIIELIITVLYFGVFQYFFKGQTLAKRLFKLKVVSIDEDKKLNIFNFVFRSLLVSDVVFSVIATIFVFILSSNNYVTFYALFSNVRTFYMALFAIIFVFRDDSRGLDDLILKTKVVRLGNEKVTNKTNKVVSKNAHKHA